MSLTATEAPIGVSGWAVLGDQGACLLAGPAAECGPEPLDAHIGRLGPLPPVDHDDLLEEVGASGLAGRGGARFPIARKIEAVATARRAGAAPLVVVNASESEPASRKDGVLLGLRPHLVLDGAALAARATGAAEAVVYLHRGSDATVAALRAAVEERRVLDLPDPAWQISLGPRRYVSGESSAVVSFLEGFDAKPRFTRVPLAASGVLGRPTLINNAETLAHLALIVRWGAQRWQDAGASPGSGPALLTLHGDVVDPGLVVEVTGPVTVGDVLAGAGGLAGPPAAILVGGYAGSWLDGTRAWRLPVEPAAMVAGGAPLGCGLLACLPHDACGIAETARVVGWLGAQGAGQCGPCTFGLPALAGMLDALAAGRARKRMLGRLNRYGEEIAGRGACRHPDGVTRLVRTAMETFAGDVVAHLSGRPCPPQQRQPVLPLPTPEVSWR